MLLNRGRATTGNDLVDMLDIRIRHGVGRDADPGAGPLPANATAATAELALADDGEGIDFDTLQNRIFDRATSLMLGGRVRLDLATPTFRDPSFPDASALFVAKAVLTNAVFAPIRLDDRDGRLQIEAIRIADWRDILPGPAADDPFIRLMYRHVLGRDPDPSGETMFAAMLSRHDDREAALRSIYRSVERRAYVHSRVAAHRSRQSSPDPISARAYPGRSR